jgi:hypothetical protein
VPLLPESIFQNRHPVKEKRESEEMKRPQAFHPGSRLSMSIQYVKGIGPKLAMLF